MCFLFIFPIISTPKGESSNYYYHFNTAISNKKEMSFLNKTPEEGLMEALYYYNIKHPEIVYAQAILESGNFKSNVALKYNNLFGLYDSKRGTYYKFNHWSESIKGYKDYIQYKYKGNDYYQFLTDIGYAEDTLYIDKIKKVVKLNKEL
jgi:flagellum-specific peptidoglycan hydrolase FlgJ